MSENEQIAGLAESASQELYTWMSGENSIELFRRLRSENRICALHLLGTLPLFNDLTFFLLKKSLEFIRL